MTRKNRNETPVAKFRRFLPGLLARERGMSRKAGDNVRTVAELAHTLTGEMTALADMRASVTGLAAALSDDQPDRPFDVPPCALEIADVDPDGLLYAALTGGDERAVAEALGVLAGALLAEKRVQGGRR